MEVETEKGSKVIEELWCVFLVAMALSWKDVVNGQTTHTHTHPVVVTRSCLTAVLIIVLQQ